MATDAVPAHIRRAATNILLASVVLITVLVAWAALEFLIFRGSQPVHARCTLWLIAGAEGAAKVWGGVAFVMVFCVGVVSSQKRGSWQWNTVVYGSALGILACLLVAILASEGAGVVEEMLIPVDHCFYAGAKGEEMGTLAAVAQGFLTFAIALSAWYAGVLAKLFKIPKGVAAPDGEAE